MTPEIEDPDPLLDEFIRAAAGHERTTLDRAKAILAANHQLASSNIYAAAILGDESVVRRFLTQDPTDATIKGGPYNWDALTYLCFSQYLRNDPSRSEGFLLSATALLDAGANPDTGWFEDEHKPNPVWESVLYGVAGIAHNAPLTKLLLDRGADPNDGETPYHAPETYNNDAVKVLVQSGKLNADGLATLLLRKADFHDYEGMKWLLEHGKAQGVDPNIQGHWDRTTLHQSIIRDNDIRIIEVLLDHGADPAIAANRAANSQLLHQSRTSIATAARRGRGDVLTLFQQRNIPFHLQDVDTLIAACAIDNTTAIRQITQAHPEFVTQLLAEGGTLLSEFACSGNTEGVRNLLDLGVDVATLYQQGDGYFEIARNSTALHVAAWRARHSTVKFLIERGAPVDAKDSQGRTPLALAVRACVDSYWMVRRSTESIEALLRAGASKAGIQVPTGYPEADPLLA